MSRTDLAVAALFLAVGIYLIVSAYQLPEGMGRLPGPGFFPAVTGTAIAALAAALLIGSRRGRGAAGFQISNGRALTATIVLLVVYMLLWGSVPFAIRTAALLVLFLRLLGERWRSAVPVAAILTLAVLLTFRYGLRVGL